MYLTLRTSIFSFSLLALTVLYSSCKKEAAPDPAHGEPWKVQINMGNFTINSIPAVTNEDVIEIDRLEDYVMFDDLPKVDFERVGIEVWIPTEKGLFTVVSDIRVRMGVVASIQTGNIYHDNLSRFKERVNYNGITYDVYEIVGYYDDELGKIGPLDFHSNKLFLNGNEACINYSLSFVYGNLCRFHHIFFEMEIEYEKGETVVGSRKVLLAVYRRI